MIKLKSILAAAMAALISLAAFTGCLSNSGSNGKQPFNVGDAHVTTPEAAEQVDIDLTAGPDPMNMPAFIEQFRIGGGSQSGARYRVYADFDEFEAEVGDPGDKIDTPITRETFIYDFIVAVYITVSSGGHTFTVDYAENDSHTVTVAVTDTPPAPGTSSTQAFETHCILIGFDAGDYYTDLVYNVTVNGVEVGASGGAES